MSKFKRVILLILDACGIGELPDADLYGDSGSNTIANTAEKVGGLNLPNLEKLGLGCIHNIQGVKCLNSSRASYGKMAELSAGKDSTVGHWEICGLVSKKPFPVFPYGFPPELISKFEKLSGFQTIGNITASGTVIIEQLGDRHVKTGKLIIYTSADSVFQIAAHKDTVPLEKLYQVCRIARDMLTDDWGVSRVIARPFEGSSGNYIRTPERKDFSLPPPHETLLDKLNINGHNVVTIGKIHDLFANRGITRSYHTKSNLDGILTTLDIIDKYHDGLIFINLVDFDMLWGHRNDYRAFAKGLEQFDQHLPKILSALTPEDLLIITADHGCDPTTKSTDHSREYVPLLVYSGSLPKTTNLGIRKTFADIAQSVARNFDLQPFPVGTSFLSDLTDENDRDI